MRQKGKAKIKTSIFIYFLFDIYTHACKKILKYIFKLSLIILEIKVYSQL